MSSSVAPRRTRASDEGERTPPAGGQGLRGKAGCGGHVVNICRGRGTAQFGSARGRGLTSHDATVVIDTIRAGALCILGSAAPGATGRLQAQARPQRPSRGHGTRRVAPLGRRRPHLLPDRVTAFFFEKKNWSSVTAAWHELEQCARSFGPELNVRSSAHTGTASTSPMILVMLAAVGNSGWECYCTSATQQHQGGSYGGVASTGGRRAGRPARGVSPGDPETWTRARRAQGDRTHKFATSNGNARRGRA
jgi:hypothetical protein